MTYRDPGLSPSIQPTLAPYGYIHTADAGERWHRLIGKKAPTALTGMLLEGALAYEEQCLQSGGLTLQQRRALASVTKASASSHSQGSCRDKHSNAQDDIGRDPLPFAIGTEFIREWKGRDHIVIMTSNGLLWSGETFGSLSAVARAITGTRWNGHRFFGLKKRREAP